MAYSDFTPEDAVQQLGLLMQPVELFPGLERAVPPGWLKEWLARSLLLPRITEKVRSELLVMPILVATRELSGNVCTIYSGQSLNVDASRGLVGECDFILARSPPLPILRAPLVTIVEAKRGDIELSLGQCIAQMVGAQVFNARAGESNSVVHGCVTTGEGWQFLRLEGSQLGYDTRRYFLDDLGRVLAALRAAVMGPP